MQKHLLLFGVALGLLSTPAIANAKGHTPSKARQVMAAANRKAASMSAETVARFFHPETVKIEEYWTSENTWQGPWTRNYTYNKAGQVLTEITEDRKRVNTYSEDGNIIKEELYYLVDGEYKPENTTEYFYDTVVKTLIVKVVDTNYDQETGEPSSTNVWGTEITRNSDGNITKLQDFSEWGGEKHYQETMEIAYGADKKAVSIKEYDDYGVYGELTDIVWETTDGQITTYEYDDPNGDMYFSNNRFASCNIIDEDHYSEPGKFTCTYDGDSYHSKIMVGDDLAFEIDFKCLEKFATSADFDECYSYDCKSFEAEFEFDEDTETFFIEYTKDRTEENRASAFGFTLYNKSVSTYKYANPEYEDEIETDEEKAEVVYDDEMGYPLSVTKYFWDKYEANDFVPRSRYTYSDYVNVDPTGVSNVAADASAEAEYYTLQGIRVSGDLTPGFYICRKGSETSKVVIR